MKKIILAVSAFAMLSLTSTPASAVTTTFQMPPGGNITSVTVNTDASTITYHFSNGDQYTSGVLNGQIWAYYNAYAQIAKNVSGDN